MKKYHSKKLKPTLQFFTQFKMLLLFVGGLLFSHFSFAQSKNLNLSLPEIIALAQSDAPNVLLAKTSLARDYWSYQSFLADFRPQIDLSLRPGDLNRSPVAFLTPEGTNTFLRRTSLQSALNVTLTQSVPQTGGQIFAGTGLESFYNFRTEANPSSSNFFATPIYIGFSQPLFGFNEMRWNRKLQPMLFNQATQEYAEEMEQIARVTTELFFNVYIAQINVETSKINKSNADTIYNVAQGRFSVGRIAETDLLQIELSVRNAEASLAQAQLQNQTSAEQLRNYLGIKEAVNFQLSPPDELPDLVIDATKALEEAKKNRSRSVELKRRAIEAEMQVSRARANTGLSANLTGLIGLSQTATNFNDVYKNPLDREEIALQLNIPIADWGKARSRLEIAKAEREFTLMDVEQERINFEREVLIHVQQYQQVNNQVDLAFRAFEIAEKREDITRKRYLIGKIEVIDLNLAIREKNEALAGYMQSLRAYWTWYYQLRSLTLYDFENNRSLVRKVDF
ncbi:MAG: TolC family protein [Bacteroidota bacterium]